MFSKFLLWGNILETLSNKLKNNVFWGLTLYPPDVNPAFLLASTHFILTTNDLSISNSRSFATFCRYCDDVPVVDAAVVEASRPTEPSFESELPVPEALGQGNVG